MRVLRIIGAAIVVLVVAFVVAAWFASAPDRLDSKVVASAGPGDARAGARVFWAGGCASCHAKPGSKGDDLLKLVGGVELKTSFGTFVTPNISPDKQAGIGGWSFDDFANAVMRGIGPGGQHLYPALPYPSYERMKISDVADLFAFLKTLPAVSSNPPADDVPFPFDIRRGVGLWNTVFLHPGPVVGLPADASPELLRGRYLVEGPGHCGECHTSRNSIGAPNYSKWLSGAPNPDGHGVAPNITPGKGGIGDWSQKDLVYFFKTGFMPDYDSVGGAMVEVQENLAKLPDSDLQAIAAYLKAVPSRPNGYSENK